MLEKKQQHGQSGRKGLAALAQGRCKSFPRRHHRITPSRRLAWRARALDSACAPGGMGYAATQVAHTPRMSSLDTQQPVSVSFSRPCLRPQAFGAMF